MLLPGRVAGLRRGSTRAATDALRLRPRLLAACLRTALGPREDWQSGTACRNHVFGAGQIARSRPYGSCEGSMRPLELCESDCSCVRIPQAQVKTSFAPLVPGSLAWKILEYWRTELDC